MKPSVSAIQDSTVSRRNGARTKTPHRPKTTLGIAASNSIMKISGVARRPGAISARKIAVRSPIGAARSSAISDDAIVPTMNGKAP